MTPRFDFRVPYDTERDELEGAAAGCDFTVDGVPQESLTMQEFTKDADLNEIVKRCGIKDHDLPKSPPIDPRYYGDVSNMPDLRTCLDRVKDATDRFMELPAALRARFHNRADLLHEFVSDPQNFEESVKLGLLKKKEEPKVEPPAPVPAVTSQ